jgi:hypothetical protein
MLDGQYGYLNNRALTTLVELELISYNDVARSIYRAAVDSNVERLESMYRSVSPDAFDEAIRIAEENGNKQAMQLLTVTRNRSQAQFYT